LDPIHTGGWLHTDSLVHAHHVIARFPTNRWQCFLSATVFASILPIEKIDCQNRKLV